MSAGDCGNDRTCVDQLRHADTPVHDLLEAFRPELLRLARRICGERDAEDAVQVALLRAAQQRSEFRGGTDSQLRAWLRTIVRNQCLLQLRAERRGQGSSGAAAPDLASAVADDGGTPSQNLRRAEEGDRLAQLLGQLTAEQMAAVSYRYFEDWSIAEIARQMDKSESAVMGLLARGLARLREGTSPSEWSRTLK